MARTDTWMPLYVGDYHADTRRLSTIEHGAYLLLLMEYWKQGPLRDSDDELAEVVGMKPDAWRKIATSIRRFFTVGEDGLLHQKRVDAERQKALELSEKRRLAGSRKGSKAAANAKPSDGESGANAEQNDDKPPANGELLLSNCTHTRASPAPALPSQLPSPTPLRVVEEDGRELRSLVRKSRARAFEAWWIAYPRKSAKDGAEKAYLTALRKGASEADLAAGLANYRFSDDEKFWPLATTWLNQGRWKDTTNTTPIRVTPTAELTGAALWAAIAARTKGGHA